MKIKYGMMQGRLSAIVNNKIQSFPEKSWHKEFKKLSEINLDQLEWTLDYKNLSKNPILTTSGKKKIKFLKKKNTVFKLNLLLAIVLCTGRFGK